MSTRTKKLIITFSIIGVFVVLMIVFGVLFSLRTINTDYLTTGQHIETYSSENIVKESGIKKGKNIIFTNYRKAEQKLEAAFPYGKFKVVRVFPNKVTIYISERVPAFKLKDDEGLYHVYDEDLKCLEIASTLEYNVPEINGADLQNVEEGEFITDDGFKSKLTQIIDGVYGANETRMSIMSDITIDFDEVAGYHIYTFTIANTGTKLVVRGDKNLAEKIAFGLYGYLDSVSQDPKHIDHLEQVTILINDNFDPENGRYTLQCPCQE